MFQVAVSDAPDIRPASIKSIARPTPRHDRSWQRWCYVLLAVAMSVGFLMVNLTFWAPANQGVDQNGYLVGGRQFAETLSMGLNPPDPFSFVGRMWIGTESQTYYPKYPLGLPFIYAVLIWIGGVTDGVVWAHLVSPVTMSLAVLGTFFLLRLVVPSFHAILGALILATGPVTLQLTNNPNSHASTLCCVVWGMYLLLRWWKHGGLWHARAAGLLIGYAATIRYTEGLLLLPVALAALFHVRDRWHDDASTDTPDAPAPHPQRRRALREAGVLLSWWALPIFILLTCNRYWFGDWTGYDSTNESTGFSIYYFLDNIETMIRQLHMTALFFTLPLAAMGLVLMFARHTRLATVLTAWILPSVLLYTAYYWAPDGNTTGYMRFFLTVVPALILAAMWLLHTTAGRARLGPRTAAGVIATLAALAVASIAWTTVHYATVVRHWTPQPTELVLWIGGPALIAAAMLWVAQRYTRLGRLAPVSALAMAAPALVGVLACGTQLYNTVPAMETGHRRDLSLYVAGQHVLEKAPPGAVIFGQDGILHHLQFIGDYRLYSPNAFNASSVQRLGNIDPDEPQGLQPQRATFIYNLFKDMTNADLAERQLGIILRALGRDIPVYVITSQQGAAADWQRRPAAQPQGRGANRQPERTSRQDQLAASVLRSTAASRVLQVRVVDQWADPPLITEEPDDARRPRGAMSRRPVGRRPATPSNWVLLQVERRPPDPAPPAQPAPSRRGR